MTLTPAIARAAPPAKPDDFTMRDEYLVDTGRIEGSGALANALALQLHGELELRFRALTTLPLTAPASAPTATTLGQNDYLYTWLRLNPRLYYKDKLSLVGQIDIPRGLVLGDVTQYVSTAREPLDDQKFYRVYPRWLYLEYESPIGVLRLGQQGSHWAMGLVANDGDHPQMFGDNVGGSIVERLLFATTPLGRGTPLVIALGADLVLTDPTARLIEDGDEALEAVLAALWRTKHAEAGVYGVIRHQTRDEQATGAFTPFTDQLTVGVVDATGKFDAPVPAMPLGRIYGQIEAAWIVGSTDYLRDTYTQQASATGAHTDESVRSFGAAATLGVLRMSGLEEAFGKLVTEVELGYASGDADPYDGVTKRFTFDPNHHVGLVLFNQVLAWKTARAAYDASDPGLVARAAPGVGFLPSNGGVFGAAYVNPRATFRPKKWLDLKAGLVIAQTTADLVDPYRFGALGTVKNYDGGDAKKHDLGLELDGGVDVRVPIEKRVTFQFGVEAGVLFPGHAFDDAAGKAMPDQALINAKLGAEF
ncbi:MAG TPA: hypothetical protein VGM56_29535 [Byssovorax sp.]